MQGLDVLALGRALFLAQHAPKMKTESLAPRLTHAVIAAHARRPTALVRAGRIGNADRFARGQGQFCLGGAGQRQGNEQFGTRFRLQCGKGSLQRRAALDLRQPQRFIGRVEQHRIQAHLRHHAAGQRDLAHVARLLNADQLFQRIARSQGLGQGARRAIRPGFGRAGAGQADFNLAALMQALRLVPAGMETFQRGQPGAICAWAQATGKAGVQKVALGRVEIDILAAFHALVVQGEIVQACERE